MELLRGAVEAGPFVHAGVHGGRWQEVVLRVPSGGHALRHGVRDVVFRVDYGGFQRRPDDVRYLSCDACEWRPDGARFLRFFGRVGCQAPSQDAREEAARPLVWRGAQNSLQVEPVGFPCAAHDCGGDWCGFFVFGAFF